MPYASTLRRAAIAGTITVLVLLPQRQASAQLQSTTSQAQCVGGAIGCSQVDFFLQFVALPVGGIFIDQFALTLQTTAYRFAAPGVTESEDALGLNFYDPAVSPGGGVLSGTFVFLAFVDPSLGNTLRIRAEMETVPPGAVDASDLAYSYTAALNGEQVASGSSSIPPVTSTPEPGTLLLAASGLAGLAFGAKTVRRAA